METLIWIVTALLMLVGLAGVVIPLLPGATLILVAAVAHRLLLPDYLSIGTLAVLAVLWLLTLAADIGGTVLGTRWGGGGKWGMTGAAAGSLAGMFVSVPAILLGSILGAAAAEHILAGKTGGPALKAGLWAGIGFLIGTAIKVVLACGMIVLFTIDCLL